MKLQFIDFASIEDILKIMIFRRKLAQHVEHKLEGFINLSNVEMRDFQSSINIVHAYDKAFDFLLLILILSSLMICLNLY